MTAPALLYPGSWLPADVHPLRKGIVVTALLGVGIAEEGGSNQGPEIDSYLRALGVPTKQPWCAAFVAAVFRQAGAAAPPGWRGASCDEWMKWGMATGRWSKTPDYGAAVLYGIPGDAQHIGILVRLRPHLYSVEGNTIVGVSYSREGVAVDLKEVPKARVLGYVHPLPVGENS